MKAAKVHPWFESWRFDPKKLLRPLKSATSNAIATIVDFALATVLFHVLSVQAALATLCGALLGGIVSFWLSLFWAFGARGLPLLPQVFRYGVVSATAAALNSVGVVLVMLVPVPFVLAWCVARAVVFALWSYPLQRDYVFRASSPLRIAVRKR